MLDGTKAGVKDFEGKNGFEYLGSLVFKREDGTLSLESAGFPEGRIINNTKPLGAANGSGISGGQTGTIIGGVAGSGSASGSIGGPVNSGASTVVYNMPNYYVTDHLGSVRVVVDQNGEVLNTNDYYPFGGRWADATSIASDNRYKYNGKEEQTTSGIGFLDYGARMYDAGIGRFHTMDRFAEKYYSQSPYSYVAGNPVKYVDINGDSVVLSGTQYMAAFEQLQTRLGSELDMSISANGTVIAKPIEGVKQSKAARKAMEAFGSTYITVNMRAENTKITSWGSPYVGGAFGGNTVNADGSVTAYQEVNPGVLGKISNAYGKPGQDMLHEATEAYEGGLFSQRAGVGIGPSAVADENNPSSIYKAAHDSAVPQSGMIRVNMYNKAGRIVLGNTPSAHRAEWFIYPRKQRPIMIMQYP